MRNAIIFGVMFLFIGDTTRRILFGRLENFVKWIGDWAPFSYLILALVLAAPVVVVHQMLTCPKPVEPENELKKYLRENPTPDID